VTTCKYCKHKTGETAFSEEAPPVKREKRKREKEELSLDLATARSLSKKAKVEPAPISKPHTNPNHSYSTQPRAKKNGTSGGQGSKPGNPTPFLSPKPLSQKGLPPKGNHNVPAAKADDDEKGYKNKKKHKNKDSVLKQLLKDQEAKQNATKAKAGFSLSQFLKPI